MSDAAPAEGLPVVQPAIPCRHLRNKGMYVYNAGTDDTGHEDYDSTIYWCQQTMKDFGPDDDPVDGQECRNTERSCYEPF